MTGGLNRSERRQGRSKDFQRLNGKNNHLQRLDTNFTNLHELLSSSVDSNGHTLSPSENK